MQDHWWFGHGYLLDPRVYAYDSFSATPTTATCEPARRWPGRARCCWLAILAVALHWAGALYRRRGERITRPCCCTE